MVVRINEKAYEIVSKAEAKALLKQQIQATVDELKNELRNELRNELTCNTSWTNYQAQTQDQIEKYWGYTHSKYRYRYRYRGEHQPYKNGEYSCPTSLNIFYNGQLRKVLS